MSAPVTCPRTLFPLSLAIAALAAAASLAGLSSPAADETLAFSTARGQTVLLWGVGLYRFDSRFIAAGFRGQDWATLLLGVPLLVGAALRYRRCPSARRTFLLLCVLAFFLYVYASMALAAAYNPLFLLYVALLSASLFAVVLAFSSVDRGALAGLARPGAPRRLAGGFMLVSGALTALVWLLPLVEASIEGKPPKLLDHYTTMVTYALDLAIVTPAAVLAGGLILRRNPVGYLIAAPLLGLIVLLGPVIAASTLSQKAAGILFTRAEALGPIAGFVVLGATGAWVLAAIARHLPDAPPSPRAA